MQSLMATAPTPDTFEAETGLAAAARLRSTPSSMPVSRESLVPWLGGATSAAALLLAGVLSGRQWTSLEWGVLLLGLLGLLAATALVALRSRAELDAADREERTRPALDELMAHASIQGLAERGVDVGSPPYVGGMARWAAAVLDLLDHAVQVAADSDRDLLAEELAAAREDTAALRDLLDASRYGGAVGVNETASLHAICTLWETNQARYETLAAEVDARWHRRWRARTVVERRMRHGVAPVDAMVLPYSN
jgi:hypothetical protein